MDLPHRGENADRGMTVRWRILGLALAVGFVAWLAVDLLVRLTALHRYAGLLGQSGAVLLLVPTLFTEWMKLRQSHFRRRIAAGDRTPEELAMCREALRLWDHYLHEFSHVHGWFYVTGFLCVALALRLSL